MKRYLVLMFNGWDFHVIECDTIAEAVEIREAELERHPIIVEVIPPLDAYTMAKREAVLAELKAATGR